MLAEERLSRIEQTVAGRGTATVTELARSLGVSESTVRRDLDKLDEAGRLSKVRGGATALETAHLTHDLTLPARYGLHAPEKHAIAERAAALVAPDDFVFLDAGSTVEELANCLVEARARYVTNSVRQALVLAAKGLRVTVLGGGLVSATAALSGSETLEALERYHFTLGFFGVNGMTPESGFTTQDQGEAAVKRSALGRCTAPYVLADSSKFGLTSLISYAPFDAARVITNAVPQEYAACENVIPCS